MDAGAPAFSSVAKGAIDGTEQQAYGMPRGLDRDAEAKGSIGLGARFHGLLIFTRGRTAFNPVRVNPLGFSLILPSDRGW
jgi:hypothetical protein